MSAPNKAYLFGGAATFPIHIEGEIKLDSYPALFLAEYGDKIKELFYIDAFLVIDDEQGNKAFLGLVKDIPGNLNYKMHAANRRFKQRLAPEDTIQPYIVMNDAGLNTLGFADLPIVVSNMNGDIVIKVPLLKSAVYVNSDFAGVEIATNTAFTDNFDWINTPIVQNTSLTNYTLSTGADYGIGTTIYYRAYVKNAEGNYYTAIQSFVTKALILSLRSSRTSPSEALSQPFYNYLSDSHRLTIGTRIYEDNATHTPIRPVNPGYYDDGKYTYEVDDNGYVIAVVATGETFPGEGGGGAPEYTIWTCWYGGSAATAYRNWQQQKSPTNYQLYSAAVGSVSGKKILKGAGNGYYAHIYGDSCYVHQVINTEVYEPATVYPAS